MKGFAVTLGGEGEGGREGGGECEEAYSSLSRRLRTMLVHYKRARAAGQHLAWMMNVHAELDCIRGERKISLVRKRLAQHNEQEVVQHVEPVEAPARAETAPQLPPKKNYVQSI